MEEKELETFVEKQRANIIKIQNEFDIVFAELKIFKDELKLIRKQCTPMDHDSFSKQQNLIKSLYRDIRVYENKVGTIDTKYTYLVERLKEVENRLNPNRELSQK